MIPELAFKNKPITPEERRSLGHLDFFTGFMALQLGNLTFNLSRLTNISQATSEVIGNVSTGIFAVSMVALYFAFYNQIKSRKERRDKRLL